MTSQRDIVDFAKDILQLDLFAGQQAALRGMADNPLSLIVCGRRSGKTLLAAVWSLYDALVRDLAEHLRPNEPRYVVCVASSQDQARRVFATIGQFLELPHLSALVSKQTSDEVHLLSGVIIKCLPCNARTTRGLAASSVVFDELAHFTDTENGYQAGEQVYRALAPSVSQFGDLGRLVVCSTPRGERGILWKLWQTQDPTIFKMQASTAEMNPSVPAELLQRESERDPELFKQEYLALFTAGGGAFLSPDALRACVGIPEHTHGRRVLGLDPAFSRDSFAVALACHADDLILLDLVDAHDPPVDFAAVMDAVAELAKSAEVAETVTDQHSAAPIVQELLRRGCRCTPVPWTAQNKVEAYSSFKVAVNTRKVRLPDNPRLLRELGGLTSTPTARGFTVEGGGERDDLASAAVLAYWRLSQMVNTEPSRVSMSANPFYGPGVRRAIVEPGKRFDGNGRYIGEHEPDTFDRCAHLQDGGCRVCEADIARARTARWREERANPSLPVSVGFNLLGDRE